MKRLLLLICCAFSAFCLTAPTAIGCTDFQLTAKDGTILITRSMEFGMDLHSNLRTSNRGRVFPSSTVNSKPTYTWKAKYGYVLLDGLGQDFATDGMNEAGLSFEALYLPGETQYQTVSAGNEGQALPYYFVGDWALSNFKSVDEVREALQKMVVYSQTLPGDTTNTIFPLHFSFYDISGKGIVAEYVNGTLSVYDNNVGMLTNSPIYPWQISNLRNYLNLSPYTPEPVIANGLIFSATGQGSGSVGLPGDASPPSRFVKVSFMRKVAYPAQDAFGVLNLAEHIINNVDIPTGLARTLSNGKESSDQTQWVVFKDLTHGVMYYRTYNDMTLRSINLTKINFAEGNPRYKVPLASATPFIVDNTAKLLGTMGS